MQKEEEAILVIHKKYGRKEPVKSWRAISYDSKHR
jgi:hypothetical protein